MLQKTGRGLFTLLLMVLEWTRPGLPSPICNHLKVLTSFIKEARDIEIAMRSCRGECSLSGSVPVPNTRVDIDVLGKKNALAQAQEVQSGLWLLQQALNPLQRSVTSPTLRSHIDNSITNMNSITNWLRSLNILPREEYTPPASAAGIEDTWQVSSASEVLEVYVNFLRGKVRRLVSDSPACQQDVPVS